MEQQPIDNAAQHSQPSLLAQLRGFSLGVRLAFGFALIAVLFLIANRINQQSAASAIAQIEANNRTNRNLDHAARSLTDALTAYHRAVRERIAVDNISAAQPSYIAADSTLTEAAAEYSALNTPIPGALAAKQLKNAVQSLQSRVSSLLASVKRRDEALNHYWNDLDRLQQQLAEPQQSAWRVGDRALTRRSVTTMAGALLNVRNAVSTYLTSPSVQRAAAIDLQEENFLIALAKNSKALASAESDAWLKKMRGDFARLRREQQSVRTARDATQAEYSTISANIDELVEQVRVGISEPAAKALLESTKLAGNIVQRTDRNVTWLTIGSLGLILLIAVFTARSVTQPVTRLILATHRLGSGEEVTRVERGGVRELDQLAGAFNEMAEQLAEAKRGVREHQAKLEDRVAARTQQLQHLAYHDALTQLPNRRHLFKHLGALLERARDERRSVVLLLLDLDNFKTLNDSLGHLFGDRVLKAVSERLLAVVTQDGFAARLGGDEFTLVRTLQPDREDIATQTERLLAAFQAPLRVDDREIIVGLSVGAAVFPDHALDAESLLRAADGALFKAKALGRNQTCISSPELVAQITSEFKTEQALRRAIQANELELHYQPQLRLSSREMNSVEALLRWKRDGTYVLPLEFLPLAEQSGLITEITDWVLKRAVHMLAEWHHGRWPEARVAVNISAQQFIDHRFVSRLQALLTLHNVPPANLELELTETVLQSGGATIATLKELRQLGVGIALDDFGAGYSSLASLEQLQLSRVKIDRSLMENVATNPRSASIARSMIAMCRSLDLQVTAEGVERPEQLAFLYQCEDVDVQGFLFSRPLAAEHVVAARAELRSRLTELGAALPDKQRSAPNTVTHFPRRGFPRQS